MKKMPILSASAVIAAWLSMAFISGADAQTMPIYKSDSNLVEMHVTVQDSHGRYIDGLTRDDFEVYDNEVRRTITEFEPVISGFSCALLMDRTESTRKILPVLKNAILQFIDAMRVDDRVAVYHFNSILNKVQGLTDDKNAAKHAVLDVVSRGSTALYDSILAVAGDVSSWPGKKAVVVFTDGQDTSSLMNPLSVTRRMKDYGLPLFFIANEQVREKPDLMATLQEMSLATVGEIYIIEKPSDVSDVFNTISEALQHTYLIVYEPPPTTDKRWRTIQLSVKGKKNVKIKAKKGYFPFKSF